MKRVYYGWVIVVMAMINNMVVVGMLFASFGLYVLPVSAEFHLSRADMNTALILMNLGLAFIAPLIGRVLDRAPIRAVMALGALAFLASFWTLSLSHLLWLSALVMLIGAPTAYLAGGALTNPVLIARWFQANRGRAMALAAIGMLIGGVLLPLLVGALIERLGWRVTLRILGVAAAAVILPLTLLVRERPGPDDVEPGRKSVAGTSLSEEVTAKPASVGAILRSPAFWLVTCGVTMAQGISQAMSVSFIPLAREGGASMLEASTILSASGVGGILGLLVVAAVADRLDRRLLLTGLLLAIAALNAVLLANASYPMLVASGFLIGATAGVVTPLLTAVLADLFGAASMGTVRGLSLPFTSFFGVVALRFAGEVFDRTGGYKLMFLTFVAAAVAAAAMIFAMDLARRGAPSNERHGAAS